MTFLINMTATDNVYLPPKFVSEDLMPNMVIFENSIFERCFNSKVYSSWMEWGTFQLSDTKVAYLTPDQKVMCSTMSDLSHVALLPRREWEVSDRPPLNLEVTVAKWNSRVKINSFILDQQKKKFWERFYLDLGLPSF